MTSNRGAQASRDNLEGLGRFVRDCRQSLKMTQVQLAERLGWTQERISTIEHGRYGMPSLPLLAHLSRALSVPLASLLTAAGYPVMEGGSGNSPVEIDPAQGALNEALYYTLQRLLSIQAIDLKDALNQTSDLMARAMGADKVDAFLFEEETQTLVALGTSNTAMGRKQWQAGLHRMPIANRGRTVEVFETGNPYYSGHFDQDPEATPGLVTALGIRSAYAVPLRVGGEVRGVLEAASAKPDAFTQDDREFFAAAARWAGMVAQRTELAGTMREQSIEEARRLAADELITALAHDLGNQITPIKGRLDLLARRAEREGDNRYLEHAAMAAQGLSRLQRMIDDLLDVSRLDQGMLKLAPQLTDLVEVARDAIAAAPGKQGQVELRAPEELVVQVDAARISQVLQNLVSNAVQHTPEGTPVVVGLRNRQSSDGSQAVIEVHDEGPGIGSELLPTLFTRNTSGPDSNGLGLGLYLARSIAEAHGGSLVVESQLGQGTTFTLSLPIIGPAQS